MKRVEKSGSRVRVESPGREAGREVRVESPGREAGRESGSRARVVKRVEKRAMMAATLNP